MSNSRYISVTGASDYDGKIFDQIRPQLHHNELYGDKAYQWARRRRRQTSSESDCLDPG
ncbi:MULTISPECIES: hypothetical protein [Nitrosomonas]|uniref:hypothetical protein n=1 Tax=Nitrosomonas TaxID=914 RepID=UPI000A59F074|nr:MULTISPECIES: hypothetical protein [Nitrosomonas]UVS60458.1 hypothetical protein NX761_13190 [Nitrosomonas sp. PLL12]